MMYEILHVFYHILHVDRFLMNVARVLINTSKDFLKQQKHVSEFIIFMFDCLIASNTHCCLHSLLLQTFISKVCIALVAFMQ